MTRREMTATMEEDKAGNLLLRGPRRVRGKKTIAGRVVGKVYRLDGRWHWRIPHPYSRPLTGNSTNLEGAIQGAYEALEIAERARDRCEQARGARSVNSTPMGGQPGYRR